MFEMAPVVARVLPLTGIAHFLQQLAGTVHGACETIGEREQKQTHARDQNHGTYRYLQQRDELTKRGFQHGPIVYRLASATEAAIRGVFERAQKFAPAVILFDEIDSIAPSRSAESAQHQVSIVAQLLVLLDGIEERGQIFVLATTNRPEHVDPALGRPGRFDQVVWMGLPDEAGRRDIFEHYLRGLMLDSRMAPHQLAAELASTTQGLTGADIAYLYQRAAMFCVKDAVGAGELADIAIARHHFDAALALLTARATVATHEPPRFLLAG
jgi:SpoVK/Ycf46/Vps4 family AAA+-type ATPase